MKIALTCGLILLTSVLVPFELLGDTGKLIFAVTYISIFVIGVAALVAKLVSICRRREL